MPASWVVRRNREPQWAGGVIGTQMTARPSGRLHDRADERRRARAQSGLHDKVAVRSLKDIRLLTQVANTPEVLVLGRGVEAPSACGVESRLPGSVPAGSIFATAGKASMSHLSLELFRQTAGIDITIVHYSGADRP